MNKKILFINRILKSRKQSPRERELERMAIYKDMTATCKWRLREMDKLRKFNKLILSGVVGLSSKWGQWVMIKS